MEEDDFVEAVEVASSDTTLNDMIEWLGDPSNNLDKFTDADTSYMIRQLFESYPDVIDFYKRIGMLKMPGSTKSTMMEGLWTQVYPDFDPETSELWMRRLYRRALLIKNWSDNDP